MLGATNGSSSGRTESELSDDDDADFDFKVSIINHTFFCPFWIFDLFSFACQKNKYSICFVEKAHTIFFLVPYIYLFFPPFLNVPHTQSDRRPHNQRGDADGYGGALDAKDCSSSGVGGGAAGTGTFCVP